MKTMRTIIILAIGLAASTGLAGGVCRQGCISSCSAHTGCVMPAELPTTGCYPQLSPYGSWLYYQAYGWVWRPSVASHYRNWHPRIHGGKWQWCGRELVWKSSYVWGQLVYSQGTWVSVATVGWVWVPGQHSHSQVSLSVSYSSPTYSYPSYSCGSSYRTYRHGGTAYTYSDYREPAQVVVVPQQQQAPAQAPTRRTQRTTSVVKTQPTTVTTQPTSQTKTKTSSTSVSPSRGGRTIRVVRRR